MPSTALLDDSSLVHNLQRAGWQEIYFEANPCRESERGRFYEVSDSHTALEIYYSYAGATLARHSVELDSPSAQCYAIQAPTEIEEIK
jgi:hypothetical protein